MDRPATAAPTGQTTRTYAVTGMTCGSCAARVAQQLEGLPEVAYASVDKATDTAVVALAVPASMD